ncbi:FHA domain-containing protein [Dactylosporangium cerinum]|uniref:FHA domain-containing protein n=1 Tax=Dactylosporangium cerinum TaxID=1434730 RepID=A0ABV9WEY3_9ACTN
MPTPRTADGPGPAGAPLAGWTVTAEPDHEFYAATGVRSSRARFPVDGRPRRFLLTRRQIWIGRRGNTLRPRPEVDLGGWPHDPGVSRLHALLLARPGGWTLLEPGSLGGTAVNGVYEPIPVDVPIPVGHGTRIHVGLWTTITLRLEATCRPRPAG